MVRVRNELEITVMLDNGAIMPTKAHEDDAGFDLYAPDRLIVRPHDSGIIDTGVHMAIPSGYVGMIKSKSGLNVKSGILCEGVLDAGYSGSIVVKAYNQSGEMKVFEKGDKLTQIVIMPIPRVKLVEGIVFSDTERGDNGFGSSGK